MHLVVVYGHQGSDEDSEKLGLMNQLVEAALCELAVVAEDNLAFWLDFNVELRKTPCLLKGIMEGHWFDLQDAWARASGGVPDVTCKRDLACAGGTRWDFILGCPLATAAMGGCWVDRERWIQPHFSVGGGQGYLGSS